MTPRRVVVADDVEVVRALVRIVLEESGQFVVVAEATTGREAIALTEQHHPDIVLLDLAMPQMSGMEALPHILKASPTTRVVVLSGFREDVAAVEAIERGATGYLDKRQDLGDIASRLIALLE